jgi:hypothetical protein
MRFPWVATAAIGAALTVLPALRARADVLIDTIGISAGYDPLSPTGSGGAGPIAVSFSTGAQGLALSSVTLVLAAGNPGDGGTIVASLWSDNPSGAYSPSGVANALPAPGSEIDTLATIKDSNLSSSFSNVSVPVTAAIALAANTRYWVELVGSVSTTAEWSYIGAADASALSLTNEYSWNNYSGMSNTSGLDATYGVDMVSVSAVPEPASLFLVGGACILLAFSRRRRV